MGCLAEASKSTTGRRCPSKYSVLAPPFPTLPATTYFQFLPSPTLNQQQLNHGDSHRASRTTPHSHTTPPPPPLTLDHPRHRLQKIDIGIVNPLSAVDTLSDFVTSGSCRLLALPFCLTLAAVGQVRQHVQPRHQRDVCCCCSGAAVFGWERGPARSSQEGHPRRHEF